MARQRGPNTWRWTPQRRGPQTAPEFLEFSRQNFWNPQLQTTSRDFPKVFDYWHPPQPTPSFYRLSANCQPNGRPSSYQQARATPRDSERPGISGLADDGHAVF